MILQRRRGELCVCVCLWVLGRSREGFFCLIFPARAGGWSQLIHWANPEIHTLDTGSSEPQLGPGKQSGEGGRETRTECLFSLVWWGGGVVFRRVQTCFYSCLAVLSSLTPICLHQPGQFLVCHRLWAGTDEPLHPQPGPGMHQPCSPGNGWDTGYLPELSWEGLHLLTCQN